jgi:hypothetical protein
MMRRPWRCHLDVRLSLFAGWSLNHSPSLRPGDDFNDPQRIDYAGLVVCGSSGSSRRYHEKMSRKRSRHDESEFSTQSSELSEDENGGIAPPPRKKTASTTYWLEELDEDNDVHEEGDGVKEPREVEKKRKKPEDVSIEIDHGDRQIRYCCPVILDEMGPPKYLPIIGPNGEKMTVESRRAMQMDETAQKMADWMKDVGKGDNYHKHALTLTFLRYCAGC